MFLLRLGREEHSILHLRHLCLLIGRDSKYFGPDGHQLVPDSAESAHLPAGRRTIPHSSQIFREETPHSVRRSRKTTKRFVFHKLTRNPRFVVFPVCKLPARFAHSGKTRDKNKKPQSFCFCHHTAVGSSCLLNIQHFLSIVHVAMSLGNI